MKSSFEKVPSRRSSCENSQMRIYCPVIYSSRIHREAFRIRRVNYPFATTRPSSISSPRNQPAESLANPRNARVSYCVRLRPTCRPAPSSRPRRDVVRTRYANSTRLASCRAILASATSVTSARCYLHTSIVPSGARLLYMRARLTSSCFSLCFWRGFPFSRLSRGKNACSAARARRLTCAQCSRPRYRSNLSKMSRRASSPGN